MRYVNISTADFITNVKLNLPCTVLNRCKTGFAHHPFQNHAPSDFNHHLLGGQFFFIEAIVMRMQIGCMMGWDKVIRKCHAFGAQLR
jgi:hypothetical protein